MRIVYADGSNNDFIALCAQLDADLDEIVGGAKHREVYASFNTLEDIHDVFIAYEGEKPVGCAGFRHYGDGAAEVKRVLYARDTGAGA